MELKPYVRHDIINLAQDIKKSRIALNEVYKFALKGGLLTAQQMEMLGWTTERQ